MATMDTNALQETFEDNDRLPMVRSLEHSLSDEISLLYASTAYSSHRSSA